MDGSTSAHETFHGDWLILQRTEPRDFRKKKTLEEFSRISISHNQSDTMQAISVSYHPEAVFVSSRNARSLRTTA